MLALVEQALRHRKAAPPEAALAMPVELEQTRLLAAQSGSVRECHGHALRSY